jgi:flavin-binding protein dodecin
VNTAAISVSKARGSINGRESVVSVVGVTEIKASSSRSVDDAIQAGVARASKTLKNVKGARAQNQEVIVDANGKIAEYRVPLKVTFILED